MSERGHPGEIAHRYLLRRMTPAAAEFSGSGRAADPRHGLPPEIAGEVLTLTAGPQSVDPALAIAVLLDIDSQVPWPQGPPALPPAPPLDLSPQEQQELNDDEQQTARLDEAALIADGYNEQDLLALRDAQRRRQSRQLRPDMLAFYRPFTPLAGEAAFRELIRDRRRTGIFITTGGVEWLAEEVFAPAGLSDDLAVLCAFAMLYGHEHGHFLADVAHAAADFATDPDGVPTGAAPAEHLRHHRGLCCPVEEAFCEAYALEFLEDVLRHRYGVDERDIALALETARAHVADGLPGYRDGARARTPRDVFDLLADSLRHAGVQDPRALALLTDLDRRTAQTKDVPLHLVVTPGSAFAGGAWRLHGATAPGSV